MGGRGLAERGHGTALRRRRPFSPPRPPPPAHHPVLFFFFLHAEATWLRARRRRHQGHREDLAREVLRPERLVRRVLTPLQYKSLFLCAYCAEVSCFSPPTRHLWLASARAGVQHTFRGSTCRLACSTPRSTGTKRWASLDAGECIMAARAEVCANDEPLCASPQGLRHRLSHATQNQHEQPCDGSRSTRCQTDSL